MDLFFSWVWGLEQFVQLSHRTLWGLESFRHTIWLHFEPQWATHFPKLDHTTKYTHFEKHSNMSQSVICICDIASVCLAIDIWMTAILSKLWRNWLNTNRRKIYMYSHNFFFTPLAQFPDKMFNLNNEPNNSKGESLEKTTHVCILHLLQKSQIATQLNHFPLQNVPSSMILHVPPYLHWRFLRDQGRTAMLTLGVLLNTVNTLSTHLVTSTHRQHLQYTF